MTRIAKLIAIFTVVMLAGAGLLVRTVSAQDDNIRIVIVSHGQASDPFWSVVQNGAAQAAKDMGVTVEYQAPGTFDMVAMSQSSMPLLPRSQTGSSSRSRTRRRSALPSRPPLTPVSR